MKTTEEHQALIIGADIGGLAAAIALRRTGYAVQAFERVQVLKKVGAGLTLWPNAVKVLRKLGLQFGTPWSVLNRTSKASRRTSPMTDGHRGVCLMQEGDSCRNTNQSVHPKIDISPIN